MRGILAVAAFLVGLIAGPPLPDEPFGNATTALSQGPIVEIWHNVSDNLAGEHLMLGACVDSVAEACAPEVALWRIIEEAKQYRGRARIGHINRAINLAIKPVTPSGWISALDAVTLGNGDCKAYAVAKYFALREAGIAADRVRLAIVHDRRHVEDHMVVAVYQAARWLVLDNLTLQLVRDTDELYFTPMFVFDDDGVRRYGS
jgi:predicted transglutaminase-like cysteine proteinase